MYYGKGIMNIQIENSIKDTPKVRNGIYLTTKSRKEGHGIGLQNVKLVVEKYHGQMEICHAEKSFQVKILFRRLRNATSRMNTAFFCYEKQITPHWIWYNRVD